MIDVYLEEQLNLPDALKYADIARSSLAAGLADERAGDSWKAAAYDVNLRVGIVNFCQGKGEVAAEAFAAAILSLLVETTASGRATLEGSAVPAGRCRCVQAWACHGARILC